MKQLESGFYYHYKHDPTGSINNYAYEVMGVGHHTEKECRPEDKYVVVYRPIYDAYVYTHGRMFDIRPFGMFTEDVVKEGRSRPRFERITDAGIIEQLKVIRDAMYS